MANYIQQYYDLIKTKKLVVGKRIRKLYRKLAKEAKAKNAQWTYNHELAMRPIQFIETYCRHSKGKFAGKPFILELWQKAFISALFGFVDENLNRRFQRAILIVARKNGKSTLAAAILLYMLVGDNESGAEVYTVATKKDQARIIFLEAVNMVRQSPELSNMVQKRKTDLGFAATFSRMEALASDTNSLDGMNSHAVGIDELHAIKDRELYELMWQSMSSREQPILLITSTAGTVRENIYDDIYDECTKIVDGVPDFEDDRTLAAIYELDTRSEWTDENAWMKANPGLGTIKKLDFIRRQVSSAKKFPKNLPGVLTKDFNIKETVAGSWLNFETIENKATFDMEEIRGSYAIGGADLSATTDLTCATLIVMKPDSRMKYVLQMYFVPEGLLEIRIKEDKIPYDIWIERGLVRSCPGNQVDFADVTAWYVEMFEEYDIRPLWIYYDRALAGYWVQDMETHGFNMVKCAQGALTFSQPMRAMEADLKDKLINYNANPVLMWCLTNTSVQCDANDNIRPIKGKSRRLRIDGMVSLLDAYVGLQEHMQDYLNIIN